MSTLATRPRPEEDLRGMYLEDIKEVSEPISREEEIELFKRYRAGDEEAGQQIVLANLRFVISVAQQYSTSASPIEDLISEGNMGLMVALENFDHTLGIKFISYAVWWIKQRIKAYVKEDHVVRRPGNIHDARYKTSKAQHELSQILDREATPEDIAEHLDISVEKVMHSLPSQWALIRTDNKNEKSNVLETVALSGDSKTDKGLEEEEKQRVIQESMKSILTDRERYVITKIFGLDGGPGMTLDKIGKSLGLTRERIRQIKEMAITKLGSRPAMKALIIVK